MTLDEALEHWHRERARLMDVDAWVDAGKPDVPPSLQQSLAAYKRLPKKEAKQALKEMREELKKDAFIRMFSAFERELRAVFSRWLRVKCGTVASGEAIDSELPSIEGVLRIAAVLAPRFDQSRAGYVSNVRENRNKLVHGGFTSPIPYELESLHHKLAELVMLFAESDASAPATWAGG